MFARKRVEGEVVYNDGEFAEVEIYGVEVFEEDLFLTTIQLHIEDTADTPEEFQQRFPVGMWLNIWLTTETSPIRRPPQIRRLVRKSRPAVGRSSGTMRHSCREQQRCGRDPDEPRWQTTPLAFEKQLFTEWIFPHIVGAVIVALRRSAARGLIE
jgi:hypothetical protein